MRVKINGSISAESINTVLNKQNEKVKLIEKFCQENKIDDFYYQDAELEYQYQKISRTRKVETR